MSVVDLTVMTPSEIDTAWAEAVAPSNQVFARAGVEGAKAARYRNAGGQYVKVAERYDAAAKELYAKSREMRDAVEGPYKAEWDRRGGWTRAYLVPAGHVHKSTNCQSLYPTTLVTWLPEQSGWDEEKIVEAAGMMACTFCYPSAPVEALRAEHEAEKKKGQCPGSGTYDHDSSGLMYVQRRARCNHCKQVVSCTSTGKMRAHKPKEQS